MTYKDRIRQIIENQHRKLAKPYVRRKRNDNPEARIMLEIKNALTSYGWSVDIIDAKGVINENGHYTSGKARAGYSDISGNDNEGHAIYIEVKATNKRNNLSVGQYHFLKEKIETNAFAIVTDSLAHTMNSYKTWKNNGKAYLLKELFEVSKKHIDSELIFDKE